MNDQVLTQTDKKPETVQLGRRSLFGKLSQFVLVASLVIGGIGLSFHWFAEAEGVQGSEVESVFNPIEIKQVPSGSSEVKVELPKTAITAQIDQEKIDAAEHPLLPLIEMGKHGQQVIADHVADYTATLTKQLRVGGKLQPVEKLFIKIRHAVESEDPEKAVPFSVYTKFIEPKKGQEVIWVEGENDNKLIAHGPTGLLNLMTVHLDPEGSMAMNGNRYPIWTIGMLNLIKLMTEEATGDLSQDDCRVEITRNFELGDTKCSRFVIVHEREIEEFGFHRAEIYIDDERNLPIGFRSYIWPENAGAQPRLQERYYYTDIKINVGLTDEDFDPSNDEYDFPGQ